MMIPNRAQCYWGLFAVEFDDSRLRNVGSTIDG